MVTKNTPQHTSNTKDSQSSQTDAFNADSNLVKMSDAEYAAQFKQMDKEALLTFLAAVLITCVFWGTIFLFNDVNLNLLHMPLWFVISCIGGYLFSVVVVLVLVKKCMRNLELKVTRFTKTQTTPSSYHVPKE